MITSLLQAASTRGMGCNEHRKILVGTGHVEKVSTTITASQQSQVLRMRHGHRLQDYSANKLGSSAALLATTSLVIAATTVALALQREENQRVTLPGIQFVPDLRHSQVSISTATQTSWVTMICAGGVRRDKSAFNYALQSSSPHESINT